MIGTALTRKTNSRATPPRDMTPHIALPSLRIRLLRGSMARRTRSALLLRRHTRDPGRVRRLLLVGLTTTCPILGQHSRRIWPLKTSGKNRRSQMRGRRRQLAREIGHRRDRWTRRRASLYLARAKIALTSSRRGRPFGPNHGRQPEHRLVRRTRPPRSHLGPAASRSLSSKRYRWRLRREVLVIW